jgi:hypothetical protein
MLESAHEADAHRARMVTRLILTGREVAQRTDSTRVQSVAAHSGDRRSTIVPVAACSSHHRTVHQLQRDAGHPASTVDAASSRVTS